MTLGGIIKRQQRVQSVLVEYTRDVISETAARDGLRAAGLSYTEVERLLQAVKDNIILRGHNK